MLAWSHINAPAPIKRMVLDAQESTHANHLGPFRIFEFDAGLWGGFFQKIPI
jgi:hypothetical protein